MIFSDNIQVFPRNLVYMGEGGEQPMIAEQGPSCNAEETVCLLSKIKTSPHIDIDLDMTELDVTAAETKATY